jgi:bis(5'-nucleosyl)-tetraphosphatase (symmetrical)
VIGDIQGCSATLDALMARVGFLPERDRLWCVGDVVNRGPDSLGVLRRLAALGSRVTVTLGNHDLHLLGRVAGVRSARRGDTLDAVLAAPDRDGLIDWLRRQPVMHVEGGFVMFHAGLLPEWKLATARRWAEQVEGALGSAGWMAFVGEMNERLPAGFEAAGGKAAGGKAAGDKAAGDKAAGVEAAETPVAASKAVGFEAAGRTDKLRMTLAALTRLRVVDGEGRPALDFKGPPGAAPAGYGPWYSARAHGPASPRFLFGHWAALGFVKLPVGYALDSGCVWGGPLTAMRLEDEVVFQEPRAAADAVSPW